MAFVTLLSSARPLCFQEPKETNFSSPRCCSSTNKNAQNFTPITRKIFENQRTKATLLSAAGVAITTTLLAVGPTYASELPLLEPSNALSLPTWAIHVSSVVEWVTAMALVWEYAERSENESWKGLSWGMVPLLGGALCACTWHFFYNSEALEVLVALQAALTVIGNATMCIAAFRIYKSSQQRTKDL